MKARWVIYTLLAYLFTWSVELPFILASRDLVYVPSGLLGVLGPIATFGPLFATLILVYREKRLKIFFQKATSIRFNWYFWVIAILIWPIVQGISFFSAVSLGDVALKPEMYISLTVLLPIFVQTLLVGGPLGEEFGWRGYALPSLLETHGPVMSSFILGIIHAFWHLPLWFVVGESARDMPFWLFTLTVVSQTPIYTWLYLRCNKSVWPVMIFHTTQNIMFFQVFNIPNGMAVFGVFFYIVVGACLISLVRGNRAESAWWGATAILLVHLRGIWKSKQLWVRVWLCWLVGPERGSVLRYPATHTFLTLLISAQKLQLRSKPATVDKICEGIAEGKSLVTITHGIPIETAGIANVEFVKRARQAVELVDDVWIDSKFTFSPRNECLDTSFSIDSLLHVMNISIRL